MLLIILMLIYFPVHLNVVFLYLVLTKDKLAYSLLYSGNISVKLSTNCIQIYIIIFLSYQCRYIAYRQHIILVQICVPILVYTINEICQEYPVGGHTRFVYPQMQSKDLLSLHYFFVILLINQACATPGL